MTCLRGRLPCNQFATPEGTSRAMTAIRLLLVAVLASVAVAVCAEPVTLTLTHAAVTTHPAHLAALQFAKRVEQRSDGQIRIEIFPAAQLGSQNETLQKLRLGAIDMDVSSLNYMI